MSDESSQVINFIRIPCVRMLQHTFSEVTVKCFLNRHIRWVTGVNTKKIALYKETKKILKSWIRIPVTGFLILCQWNLDSGFRIPIASGIPHSLGRIPDSKSQDYRLHQQNFRILDSKCKISQTSRSEITLQGAKRKYYVTDEGITLLNS